MQLNKETKPNLYLQLQNGAMYEILIFFRIVHLPFRRFILARFPLLKILVKNFLKLFVRNRVKQNCHIFPYSLRPLTTLWYELSYKEICPWCNGYRRRKWTRQHEFKSWTRQIAFHIALKPLGKVWVQLF